jgi:hypothetical protein
MCYKCLGSGVVQFLIFEDVCVVCGGVGRVFFRGFVEEEGGRCRETIGGTMLLFDSESL